ncbi:hypothetical protein RN001_005483 [Aquatica leii]|uniref:Uncharacterized protein n=1 Tax=Aquatica leii TaxID=1421715 RepID=A0AAN7SIX4_9COLE|nr:hypothetical protein RN001_005483 [Aquatica leii]
MLFIIFTNIITILNCITTTTLRPFHRIFITMVGVVIFFIHVQKKIKYVVLPTKSRLNSFMRRPNRRGNGRRRAIFPIKIWSVYDRVLNNVDRTNNHAEAAHRRLQEELGMNYPYLWAYITALKKVQKGRDVFYEQMLAGRSPPKKLKKCRDADRRIKTR